MKNIRNYVFALMIMVGVSSIESTGVYFWVAFGLTFIPLAVLGIEEIRKQKAYEKALENSRNVDYLLDCVIFGEWEMMEG